MQTSSEDKKTATPQDDIVSAPEPNIIFVSNEIPPTTKIHNGMNTIKLPKIEEQADMGTDSDTGKVTYKGIPFYHEEADTIVRVFPTMYKRFVKKGS